MCYTPLYCRILINLLADSIPDLKPAIQHSKIVLPISLKYAVLNAFRHSHQFLEYASNIDSMMQHWIATASALHYTDDVGESVVDTLLRMAFRDGLRQHIPVDAWDWLKKRPDLRPDHRGLKFRTNLQVFEAVLEVGDLELIISYLSIVWSRKWSWSYPEGFTVVLGFIRSGLRGIGGVGYQEDLIKRLDDVLSQMNSDSSTSSEAADDVLWYTEFRTALREVNEEAVKTLTGMSLGVFGRSCLLNYVRTEPHSTFMCAVPLPYP